VYSVVKGTRQAGWRAGGVPAKLGSVLTVNPPTPSAEEGGEPVEVAALLRRGAKASYGKRVGVPAKLGGVHAGALILPCTVLASHIWFP
jgi:hypothetical protein